MLEIHRFWKDFHFFKITEIWRIITVQFVCSVGLYPIKKFQKKPNFSISAREREKKTRSEDA